MPCGHHNNQSPPAFPIEHKLNPSGVFFVDIIIMMHSDTLIMATKCSADTAVVEKAKRKRSILTLEVKITFLCPKCIFSLTYTLYYKQWIHCLLCLSVHKINPPLVLAAASVCLLPPMSILVPASLRPQKLTWKRCIVLGRRAGVCVEGTDKWKIHFGYKNVIYIT